MWSSRLEALWSGVRPRDELWERLKPLLPKRPRRRRRPGRKPLDDRACLNGILFVLLTGNRWDRLPQQLGYGSGMTCWRRLRDWQQAGVWDQPHALPFPGCSASTVAQSSLASTRLGPRPARWS
jgi:hypothetical protein